MAIAATLSALSPIPSSPTFRVFNVTCADADTGPTAFNHGITGLQASQLPIAIPIPQISVANTALANWGVTVSATQFTLSKQSATGSGGAVPGTTVVLQVLVLAPNSIN